MCIAAHLTRPTRTATRKRITCRPYLVLLPVGLAVPLLLAGTRCALTAPFQPCRGFRPVGGFISVALSLRLPSADVIRHRVSVEPGLSSSFSCGKPAAIRPSDASESVIPASEAQAQRERDPTCANRRKIDLYADEFLKHLNHLQSSTGTHSRPTLFPFRSSKGLSLWDVMEECRKW